MRFTRQGTGRSMVPFLLAAWSVLTWGSAAADGTPVPSGAAEKPALAPESPTSVVQEYVGILRTFEAAQAAPEPAKKRKSAGKHKKNEEAPPRLSDRVRNLFDFDELTRRSLGPHWEKISPEEREEFSALFMDLIEESYLERSQTLVKSNEVTFGLERVNRDQARVDTKIKNPSQDADLSYLLHRNHHGWRIYDMVFDDVELSRNYQSQFNQIIFTHGFGEVLNRMRTKKLLAY